MTINFKIDGKSNGSITITPDATNPYSGGTWSVNTPHHGAQPTGSPWTYSLSGNQISSLMDSPYPRLLIGPNSFNSLTGIVTFGPNCKITSGQGKLKSPTPAVIDLTWEASATNPDQDYDTGEVDA